MRVLVLTTDAYGGHGGIAFYNRCLAEAMAEMSEISEIIIFSRVMRFTPKGVPKKIRLVLESVGGKLNYLRAALRMLNEPLDYIVCGHINLLRLAAVLGALKKIPVVLQVHGIEVWSKPKMLDRLCLPRVKKIWSVSETTRDRMIQWSRVSADKFVIIPNTFHAEDFGPAEKSSKLVAKYGLAGRKVIMTLARLAGYERYKGIDEIIEVMPSLLETDPNIVYLVVGDGDDTARLESKAIELGVQKSVIFAGFVNESEKADHYRLADAFALPGRGEGFGIVYLEAMACGIPVVGSKLDGSREALRDGMLGELVDPKDMDSIKNAIFKSLNKPKSVPDGLSFFDWQHFSSRVRSALAELGVSTNGV